MIQEDKLRHIENIEKSMTGECFKVCYNKKKFMIDFECVSTFYNKYIFAIGEIRKIVEDEGRLNHSNFVAQSLGEVKKDRFMDEAFPIGGHPVTQEGAPLRRKFFEAYHYSDPLRKGR